MWVRSLDWEDPLEEGMATHSSILALDIPCTEEPGLEKRKPWYSIELYNHINKKEQEKKEQEQENKLLIQKMMEQQGIDSNKFEIELVDEELPSIIEEE